MIIQSVFESAIEGQWKKKGELTVLRALPPFILESPAA